ncbi:MAG: imidazolonepropionase [Alphaproteobacteria bacterium]|nr:imidazolonepropionase [Alphaproteobacteria bacterium]
MTESWDILWLNARVATMKAGAPAYGLIADGAVGVSRGAIVWVGPVADVPVEQRQNAQHVIDCRGDLVTPGMIDCHTHLVYGGNRAREFEMRLEGATYADIARAGGGINSTVRETRAADENALFATARTRLQRLMAEGVTTIEIKSGYGLDRQNEMKMLAVARRLGEQANVSVHATFLGAHALPPEFEDRADAYIDLVCQDMLPAVAEADLADAVDAFCENIAFSTDQVRRVFEAATALGLPVKIHAEQLSNQGGAELAASFGALSADHLEYLDETGARAMAEAATVAVLLPGAFYFLRETQLPPIEMLRDQGVRLALASDSNPGSSPVVSLLLMLNMGCTLFGMTPEEALAGVTRNAAAALGIDDQVGTIERGKRADLVLWRLQDPAELAYRIGDNPVAAVVRGGVEARLS